MVSFMMTFFFLRSLHSLAVLIPEMWFRKLKREWNMLWVVRHAKIGVLGKIPGKPGPGPTRGKIFMCNFLVPDPGIKLIQ